MQLTKEIDKPEARTLLEQLLNTTLPDWQVLLKSAEEAKQQQQSFGMVAYAEKDVIRSPRGLEQGSNNDVWEIEDGLCLYRHPGLIEIILGWLFALVDKLLAPIYRLKDRLDAMFINLARKIGNLFVFLSVPLAILGFISDVISMIVAFLRSIPSLLLHPIRLLKGILLIPFRVISAFLSRLIRTLLLTWIAKLLDLEFLKKMLLRYPWLRGILLGFLRQERPPYPALIPKRSVSQVLLAKRLGLFGMKEYLVIVEGDALQTDFGAWITFKIKQFLLPFYWERTIHMLFLSTKEREKLIQKVCSALGKSATNWK